MTTYDAVVAGGAISGLSAAYGMARRGALLGAALPAL
jgi:glycine/D-amino acid oxidase-like deaminating enzyme